PSRARQLTATLAAVLLVAACSTVTPSPTPSPTPSATPPPTVPPATPTPGPTATPRPLAEVYGDIRNQVEAIRGLKPTEAVEPVVIDAAQLATNLQKEFDDTHTDAALKDAEDELITLGFLPAGTSLRAITLAFQGGQVAGYYSPESNELFVVSRTGNVN